MLASTPTTEHVARRPSRCDLTGSPSRPVPPAHRTPPRMPTFRRARHSPSPLTRHSLPVLSADADDPFSSSPGKARNSGLFETEDAGLFSLLSSSAKGPPASSSPVPLRTPVKPSATAFQAYQTPARPVLSVKPTNTPFSAAVGTKRKPGSLPFTTPDRNCILTPLTVTNAADDSGPFGFDRLAPLPAPRFGMRTPQTRADTEQYLTNQADSMRKLKLGDRDQPRGAESGYDSELDGEQPRSTGKRLFEGNVPPSTVKSKSKKLGLPPVLSNEDEVVESRSPGGHVNKRRARSRPVSSELLKAVVNTPAPGITKKVASTPLLNTTRSSNTVTFPTYGTARTRRTSASSVSSNSRSPPSRSRLGSGSTARTRTRSQHQRAPLNRLTSHSSASLFFGPSIPQTEARPKKRSTDAMSIDAPAPLVLPGRPQTRIRHSTGSPWRSPTRSSEDMDEEELFFSSPPNTSFMFSVTGDAPSPTKKQRVESVEKLPTKYRPRDSGVVLDDSDDDDIFGRPSGFSTRGGQLFAADSGSLSSLQSESSVEALVTPGAGPSPESGWPTVVDDDTFASSSSHGSLAVTAGVDAFIFRTLTAGAKPPAPGEYKRPPGTPVKKVKTSHLLERPWQSAMAAHKIGFPEFDPPKDDKENKTANKPRKSLPAAFPTVGAVRQRRDARTGGGLSIDLDHEEEEGSPTTRKEVTRYGHGTLGLGRPPVPPFPKSCDPKARTRWLMRRSSSGAFSSGSETATSRNATPTRLLAKDWAAGLAQQSPLATNAPLLDTTRSNTSTTSASSSTIVSPTVEAVARHGHAPSAFPSRRAHSPSKAPAVALNPSPKKRVAAARATVFPGSAVRGRMSITSAEERPGRFEREFVEIDELGRGEFGRVMKAQYKEDEKEVFAVKKSKRFEGVKHRLRLREEVDILKHLSTAAARAGFGLRHPNVLGYIDSWEEEETLFIQTELCALGNFSRFLWEYGRAFPRLDEPRVWKIFAELSSGLNFIHGAGVIHLDLKPANIFVTEEGRFKIGDFGMASIWPRPVVKDASNPTGRVSFEREGDKLYLAPEVLQGRYCKAADIFSLGMTMLETATNIIVPDQGEAWHRIRHEDFAQVDLAPLSLDLVQLLKSMLRSDPALRIDAEHVCAHPVVARARASMEDSRRELGPGLQSSALAGTPPGWLDDVLGYTEWDGGEGDEAMDVC